MPDQLVSTIPLGSTDWAGRVAPAGGSHTGTSTITMIDGLTFTVAHAAAEVARKRDAHAVAPGVPAWVAFDVPLTAVPVVLDTSRIASVS